MKKVRLCVCVYVWVGVHVCVGVGGRGNGCASVCVCVCMGVYAACMHALVENGPAGQDFALYEYLNDLLLIN